MAATNSVLANDTAITLDWSDVLTANLYHLQVAIFPDFSGTLMVDDNALAGSTKAFTDTGANDAKRWWRWRYSTDAGTTWSEWSQVGSYYLLTTAANDITLANGKWTLVKPTDVTDIYTLPHFPLYSVFQMSLYREKSRNRLGTLLSEYVTTKDKVTWNFDEGGYMQNEQMAAIRRFNAQIKTFFLAVTTYNLIDHVPNIWKVQFAADPELTMIRPGREDLFIGTVEFEEV